MATRKISIRVSEEAAETYERASEKERRKLDVLLSMRLAEASRANRPLEEIMTDIGREAESRGLTPEKLRQILDE